MCEHGSRLPIMGQSGWQVGRDILMRIPGCSLTSKCGVRPPAWQSHYGG